MSKIIVLVGLPGAKKTTWAKDYQLANGSYKIVSFDAIREMLYGRYDYREKDEEMIKYIGLSTVSKLIISKHDVIIDDSMLVLTRFQRAYLVKFLRDMQPMFGTMQISAVSFPHLPEHRGLRKADPRGLPAEHWDSVFDKMLSIYEPMNDKETFDLLWR